MAKKAQKQIILGVTGSIAAYKACDIIRSLQKKGVVVTPVMTKEAHEFITPLTLASLANRRVYSDLFDKDFSEWDMEHVSLAKQADLLVIAPATANIIGKIASGIADDLLTCIAMTTKAKIVMAPAMNTAMYKNVFVQKNITALKKSGVVFVDPIKGLLACGDAGEGHLAEVSTIAKKVCTLLKKQ